MSKPGSSERRSRLKKAVICVLFGLAGLVAVSEAYLYFKGFPACHNDSISIDALVCDVTGTSASLDLGWYNRYCPPNKVCSSNDKAETSIWQNGQRASYPLAIRKDRPYRIAVLGCSYTFGLNVPDNETYSWMINSRFPRLQLDNYGVSGYGPYQCYRREQLIWEANPSQHYDMVIYAALGHHLCRDSLDRFFFKDKEAVFVYPKMQPGKAYERRLTPYCWYGDSVSRLINLLKITAAVRREKDNNIRHRMGMCPPGSVGMMLDMLGRMQQCAQEHNARFILVNLDRPMREATEPLQRYCQEHRIDSFRLELPDELQIGEDRSTAKIGDKLIFPYRTEDGQHPNAAGHAVYAQGLAEWFKTHLPAEYTEEYPNTK